MAELPKLKLNRRIKLGKNKLIPLASGLVGICVGILIGYFTFSSTAIEEALVIRVIDGDTIELADGQRVRYLGIDTPEQGEFFATEASAKNKELVEGKVVKLQSGNRDQDEYGRLLRYVYIDGIFVNAELVAQGYATAYIFDPDEQYSQIIVQLEQYAKLRNIGIWR